MFVIINYVFLFKLKYMNKMFKSFLKENVNDIKNSFQGNGFEDEFNYK